MKGWEILVVDDGSRFPLHVWRYLTGSLGFGIGNVEADGRRKPDTWIGNEAIEDRGRKPETWISDQEIYSEDGRHRLRWVSADGETLEKLKAIVSRLEAGSRIYALLDVHGKPGYSAGKAYAELERQAKGVKADCRIDLVSAYHSGHRLAVEQDRTFPVLPKSRETLRGMIRELGIVQQAAKDPHGVRHILVTGAGFEIKSPRGGFGMPLTRYLLKEMGSPFQMKWLEDPDPKKKKELDDCFPVPAHGIWEPSHRLSTLRKLALREDLDNYWDYLLRQELDYLAGDSSSSLEPRERGESKARALQQERRLREAYRVALLRHDWGFMNQSLDAARLPLHAWLTTNYTRFADRAIDLYGDAGQKESGRWRIISTASEARPLAREDSGVRRERTRYLFKLHGDISHLQTMAIAGCDKDLFSPLSMQVEDLYEVYAAAERFLIESLPKSGLVVWHIVGHGLQDWRLCDLLARVWCKTLPDQVFVIANPKPQGPRDLLLKSLEGEEDGRPLEEVIHSCSLTAAEYMARLLELLRGNDERFPEISRAEDFRQWCDAAKSMGSSLTPNA